VRARRRGLSYITAPPPHASPARSRAPSSPRALAVPRRAVRFPREGFQRLAAHAGGAPHANRAAAKLARAFAPIPMCAFGATLLYHFIFYFQHADNPLGINCEF
jgi:hypothetical protein